jgi:hypothetical protein
VPTYYNKTTWNNHHLSAGFLLFCPQISSATIRNSLLGVWTEALINRGI